MESGGWGGVVGVGVKLENHRDKTEQNRDTFIAESIYLVLIFCLWDWKPVDRLKQRSNVVGY